MTDYSFQTLHSDGGARVIFRGIVGSRAYGTNRPGSDEDVRGVFLVPPVEYALLAAPPEQVADERNDRLYYSLRRFAELAAASNPNALEMFWLPPDCIRLDTPRFARLRENRALFLSRRAVDTHIGYALAQIKKARGCNKRVWNPQPEEPPAPEAFCDAPAPPASDAIGPLAISMRSMRNVSMKRPGPRPIGKTPSNAGSVPPMPRTENWPGLRTRSDLPPVSMPGT